VREDFAEAVRSLNTGNNKAAVIMATLNLASA
jgi:hypothetical protein